jgi:hypothetical protein
MQVCKTIPQTRPQMQQRARRLLGHSCVSVGRTGYNTLKQSEDATHLGYAVQSRYKMNL